MYASHLQLEIEFYKKKIQDRVSGYLIILDAINVGLISSFSGEARQHNIGVGTYTIIEFEKIPSYFVD